MKEIIITQEDFLESFKEGKISKEMYEEFTEGKGKEEDK